MRFAVLLERADDGGYGAYSPDAPGVFAAGETVDETLALFEEGLRALIESIRREGGPMPVPGTIAATIEIEDVA